MLPLVKNQNYKITVGETPIYPTFVQIEYVLRGIIVKNVPFLLTVGFGKKSNRTKYSNTALDGDNIFVFDLFMYLTNRGLWGVLKFGLVEDVPLAAQDPYPCSGVICLKIGTQIRGFFRKKVPISCDLATNTPNFNIFHPGKILKIRPMVKYFKIKNRFQFQDFLA